MVWRTNSVLTSPAVKSTVEQYWGTNTVLTLPAVSNMTVELYGAPTQRQHSPQSRALLSCMGHKRCVDIASCQEHGGAVRGTNAALTLPAVKSTVELYGAPTQCQHSLPSRALWSSMGHQRGVEIAHCQEHCREVRGANIASSQDTVEQYRAPTRC